MAPSPDPTQYATALELAQPAPAPLRPAELPPGLVARALGHLQPRRWDSSWWVPTIHHNYYSELDHGYRSATRGVVLHVNDGYYQGTLDFFHNNGGVGAHFELGFQKGQSTQLVPLNRVCWHAVQANAFSIGVEHAGFGRNRAEWLQNGEREIRASAQIVSWILHRYNLGPPKRHTNIFFHSDGGASWGGHACPGAAFPYDVWERLCRHYFDTHWMR